MDTRRYSNMMAAYDGHTGPVTVGAVLNHIPAELFDRLTGRELGLVMSAVNSAYHAGRAAQGAEVYDSCPRDGAVWIDCLGRSITWRQEGDGSLALIAGPAHAN